ncbi:MAG: Na+/H+ antiporter subunit E [Parachlamydiaceae bacterium]
MIAFVVNIILAIFWVILAEQPTFAFLLLGYLIGFGLIAVFSNVIGGKHYVQRVLGVLYFLSHFFVLFIKANLEVAKLVLFVPNKKIRSKFVDYEIEDMTLGEALLLSYCITLTPGTIIADFDWKRRWMRIHVLDHVSDKHVKEHISQTLKKEIWKFTR